MTLRFTDSDAQALIRSTARAFLAERYPWERLYAIERGETKIGRTELGEFAELGWLALVAPLGSGGAGVSLLEAAVVIEECGYAAVPAPIAVSNIAADLLARCGCNDVVRSIASGRLLYTINKSSRRRGNARPTLPALSGDGVRGSVSLLPFGEDADFALTPVDLRGVAGWAAVPLGRCRREPVDLLHRRGYAHVRLDGVPASEVQVLAEGDEAEALHERCDALVTALSLIELAGMMQRVLEMTTAYISTRVQFGQPIAKFQAARHRAAELLMQAETVRWSAYHALWRFQNDPPDTREIWLAKHWAVRAAERVFEVAHLLHGGVGVGTEYPLHLYTQAIAGYAARAGTMDEMVVRTLDSLDIQPRHAVTSDRRQ